MSGQAGEDRAGREAGGGARGASGLGETELSGSGSACTARDRSDRSASGAACGGDPHAIETLDALRDRYGAPHDLVLRKVLRSLDGHCRRFVARSPLVMMATADAEGRCDVSPRGDAPGFVRVLDCGRLALPDRKGNDRLDGMRNVLENARVGLLFVVPGCDDTLRVNGRATITADQALLASMAVAGREPRTALIVTVEEAFLHCGRAFKRGRVWDPGTFAARGELPTLGQVLRDQTDPDAAERRLLAESESAELY